MNENSKSPWRIPVFWLVIGLPLLSIVAGVGLVIISVRSGGSDAVSDPVRRVSQIQTANLGPDEAARKRGLSVVLRVEDGIVEVLPATGDFAKGSALQLVLEHPTRQAADVSLELVPEGAGWRTEHTLDHEHDWLVQLRDADGQWRLHGRLPREQHATRLSPSLGGGH
ncbi:FixH family protein [Stenotrophomonas sp. JC08]|uniref:FixH family protein n=1 Tax=Stenotrophomonas sp. JC08 TaxID=3445779 RepID=UPI003FA2617A